MIELAAALSFLLKEAVFFVSYVKHNAFPHPLSAEDEKKYLEEQALKKFPRYNQHIIHRSEFSVITAGNNKNKRSNEVSYIISYILLRKQFKCCSYKNKIIL